MTKNIESTRFASSNQEHYVAKLLHGQVCPNSGAGKWSKSDVKVPQAGLSIECKTSMTSKNSFSIKKEWIDKHKQEAFSNRLPNTAIAISFDPKGDNNYFVIDSKLMQYLVEKLIQDSQQ